MKNIKNKFDLLGLFKFLAAAFFVFHFVFISFENAWLLKNKVMMVSIVLLFLLAIIALVKEFHDVQKIHQEVRKELSIPEKLKMSLVFTFASFFTYLVQTMTSQNIIFAASFITIIMVYLVPVRFNRFEITVYTGTITGMAEVEFIHHWELALVFGLVSSVFYLIFQPSFRATGGRAGFTSYVNSLFFMYFYLDFQPEIGAQIPNDKVFSGLLFVFAAGFITYFLHQKNILSVVKSAMIVTLFFELIIPENLYLYTLAAFLGTIVAMTGEEKVKNTIFLALTFFLSYLFLIFSYPLLSGTTGKLGLVALTGFLATDGIFIAFNEFRERCPKIIGDL